MMRIIRTTKKGKIVQSSFSQSWYEPKSFRFEKKKRVKLVCDVLSDMWINRKTSLEKSTSTSFLSR